MPSEKKASPNAMPAEAEKNSSASLEAFVKHLQNASEVVRSWPAWKQHVLGGGADQSKVATSPNPPSQ